MYLMCQDQARYVAGFSEVAALAPDVTAIDIMFRRYCHLITDEADCWDKVLYLFRAVLSKTHVARQSGKPGPGKKEIKTLNTQN